MRKPPQVLAINRREEQDRLEREAAEARAAADAAQQRAAELENAARAARGEEPLAPVAPQAPQRPAAPARPAGGDAELFDMGAFEGLTMADLLGHSSPGALGWVLALMSAPALLAVDALDKQVRNRRRAPQPT